MECGNNKMISNLLYYKNDKIPSQFQCTHEGCKWKWTHTSDGHICNKCNKNHHSRDCVLQSPTNAERMYNISLEPYYSIR